MDHDLTGDLETIGTQIEADLPRGGKGTWNVGFGAHYRLTDTWLLMSGVSWVSSAVNSSNRTPDLPVDQQWRFGLGVEYEGVGSRHPGHELHAREPGSQQAGYHERRRPGGR